MDTVAGGIQAEATETVFAVDGRIDYELIATADGDVTQDFVYDSQGRVEKIHHFADDNDNRVFDTGDTLLAGFEYTDQTGKTVREGTTDSGDVVEETSFRYDVTGRMTGVDHR